MFRTANTKENREQSRAAQFTAMIDKGYKQETFKKMDFFTIEENNFFTLKVFRGTSANHVEYVNYRTEERRAEVIANYKNNYERHESYKQECKNNPAKSTAANCAAAIREELKKTFAGIKFSVTSENFSMGNSVRINWTDGPTEKEVAAITGKYQYGSFNSMEDLYENTNSREDIPQAKYVQESRNKSDAVAALATELEKIADFGDSYDAKPNVIINRIFHNTSLPANAIITGIQRNEVNAGQYEDFYKITFTTPEEIQPQQGAAQEQPETPVLTTGDQTKIQVIDYSAKAFAVVGETKEIREKLKEFGGKYNAFLKCGKGWIFSKSRLPEVTAYLETLAA